MTTPSNFAAVVERFFTQRLMQQRQTSRHTISSYSRGASGPCGNRRRASR